MVNYAETTSSSTNVPLTPVSCSQHQEPLTEPLLELAEPQGIADWTTDSPTGHLLYKGKLGEIRIPGMMWMYGNAAFAQGFQCGRELLLERGDGRWSVLSDQQFTHLITQHLPAGLPAIAIDPWKQGFIFGWCMTWYHQPFLDEEADAYGEDESEAPSCGTMY